MSILSECRHIYTDEPRYFKMIMANILNRFGDAIDVMALGWLVYEITDSPSWVAVILGANIVPTVILQPFTGVWVNYMDKKKVTVFTDLIRGLLVLIIAVLTFLNSVTPMILLCVTILISTAEAFRNPCGLAVVSVMIKKENMSTAVSLNQAGSQAGQLIGMSIAGIVIATMGTSGAMAIDAITFFLSAGILMLIKFPKINDTDTQINFFTEFKNGLKYFKTLPLTVFCTVCCFLICFFEVPLINMKSIYIKDYLALGELGLSVNGLAMAVGLFIGAILAPKVCKNMKSEVFISCFGIFAGITLILHNFIPLIENTTFRLATYAFLIFIYAIASSGFNIVLVVILMKNVESQYMSRVGGIFNSFATLSEPISSFILGAIILIIPLSTIYWIYGIGAIITFIIISFAGKKYI